MFVYKYISLKVLSVSYQSGNINEMVQHDNLKYKNQKIFKRMKLGVKAALLLVLLATVTLAYEEEDHVLVLHDNDFPQVLSEFPAILIQFYAPWCGHCKKLAPIYKEVALALHQQNLAVRVAKVDATVESKAGSAYGVRGYPTLIYFKNGQKMDYNGQRTKDFMVNWLKKRISDPVTKISKEEYEKLNDDDNEKVCVVFHGDLQSEQGKSFETLGSLDDYNSYFNVEGDAGSEGSVVMIRPFGDDVTYEKVDSGLKDWISGNDRPLVLPFDDRTISSVFHQGKDAIVFYNAKNNREWSAAFKEVAQHYNEVDGGKLKFTELEKSSEHFSQLGGYLKVSADKHPIFILNAKKQEKFIMNFKVGSELTADQITKFITSWSNGEITKFGLTDEIKESVASQDVEQQEEL